MGHEPPAQLQDVARTHLLAEAQQLLWREAFDRLQHERLVASDRLVPDGEHRVEERQVPRHEVAGSPFASRQLPELADQGFGDALAQLQVVAEDLGQQQRAPRLLVHQMFSIRHDLHHQGLVLGIAPHKHGRHAAEQAAHLREHRAATRGVVLRVERQHVAHVGEELHLAEHALHLPAGDPIASESAQQAHVVADVGKLLEFLRLHAREAIINSPILEAVHQLAEDVDVALQTQSKFVLLGSHQVHLRQLVEHLSSPQRICAQHLDGQRKELGLLVHRQVEQHDVWRLEPLLLQSEGRVVQQAEHFFDHQADWRSAMAQGMEPLHHMRDVLLDAILGDLAQDTGHLNLRLHRRLVVRVAYIPSRRVLQRREARLREAALPRMRRRRAPRTQERSDLRVHRSGRPRRVLGILRTPAGPHGDLWHIQPIGTPVQAPQQRAADVEHHGAWHEAKTDEEAEAPQHREHQRVVLLCTVDLLLDLRARTQVVADSVDQRLHLPGGLEAVEVKHLLRQVPQVLVGPRVRHLLLLELEGRRLLRRPLQLPR
mmetsp:Transcript_73168/g.211824  ORF Transcript_73168/g.211824 Transcript_73168/m.211824 type:complete len:543 (-) Transcript_73168:469-2097(-)